MSTQDNSKIIEKIKKLLELASSPNDAEAKLAFSRAQELIAKYSVSMTEDKAETIIRVEYHVPFKINSLVYQDVQSIVLTISKIFGCYSLWFPRSDNRIEILGFQTNIEVSKYACDSVLNQLNIDFKAGYRVNRNMGYAAEFWRGASEGIRKKFSIETKTGEGLILYDKVSDWVQNNIIFGTGPSTGLMGVSGSEAGKESGLNASIRAGVGSSQKGNLLK